MRQSAPPAEINRPKVADEVRTLHSAWGLLYQCGTVHSAFRNRLHVSALKFCLYSATCTASAGYSRILAQTYRSRVTEAVSRLSCCRATIRSRLPTLTVWTVRRTCVFVVFSQYSEINYAAPVETSPCLGQPRVVFLRESGICAGHRGEICSKLTGPVSSSANLDLSPDVTDELSWKLMLSYHF